MRLSTAVDRDEARAVAVIHAALDVGATFLDTADAYCHDDADVGHNERLIATAIASWPGDRARVVVATKGGLRRPGGRWVPDGRAAHLAAACDASRRALGVDRIALYQLHAPDPRTPLATSVRALAALRRAGAVERIGLCNVSRGQIEAGQQIAPIDAVQVELSVFQDREILSGVVKYCVDSGIDLIAYRPLGGVRKRRQLERDPVLAEIARRHGVTPPDIAIAWLRDLAGVVIPIPGPTRLETARGVGRAAGVVLSEDDRAMLDERVPAGARLRVGQPAPAAAPAVQIPAAGEVVLVMGMPAAGKSTVAASFVERGYSRLNRDESGGTLAALAARLGETVASGATRIVADNTYATRQSRARILEAASRHGLRVRGLWLETDLADAQANAAGRMISRYGRLLDPDEIRATSRRDPAIFGPGVLFRYQRDIEPPEISEGFAEIERVPFERRVDPAWSGRAVIVWADGVLRRSQSGRRTPMAPDDLDVPVHAGITLRRFADDGFAIVAIGWRPELADGTMTAAEAAAIDARMIEQLGVALVTHDCPHPAGPPVCWCRKPLPGLGVLCVQKLRLAASRCVYVGGGPQDPGFARRCGFQYADASEFFAPGAVT
jgi:aryl-alcohol dehydrogenase-like predicted oxidoreductase/predicted kinase/histidinol phosphatase-like enzyme